MCVESKVQFPEEQKDHGEAKDYKYIKLRALRKHISKKEKKDEIFFLKKKSTLNFCLVF